MKYRHNIQILAYIASGTYVHAFMCLHYTLIIIGMHMCILSVILTCTHACVTTHTYACVPTHMYMYVCMYTHTHTARRIHVFEITDIHQTYISTNMHFNCFPLRNVLHSHTCYSINACDPYSHADIQYMLCCKCKYYLYVHMVQNQHYHYYYY